MSELQQARDAAVAQADKLAREAEILHEQIDRLAYPGNPSEDQVVLAVQQSKRVRRESNLLVRVLAQLRDHLQPNGGTR